MDVSVCVYVTSPCCSLHGIRPFFVLHLQYLCEFNVYGSSHRHVYPSGIGDYVTQ